MKLTTLKPRIQAIPGRLQLVASLGTKRIRGGSLQVIRARILRRDCGLCQCLVCRSAAALKVAHEVEHLIPLWAGGLEEDGNRYAIARDCHELKTRCEARMRAAGGYSPAGCQCGRHPQE